MRIMSRLCAPLYHLLIGALLCLPLVASALDVALVRRLFASRPGPSAWGR